MSSADQVRARAPGKIILSGEHAVVYGRPALVTAVNRYITVIVSPSPEPRIRFEFGSSDAVRELPLSDASSFNKQTRSRLQAFDDGLRPIQAVVQDPLDLLLFSVCDAQPERGMDIALSSDIPIGSGMGSSAAAAAAVLCAIHECTGSKPKRSFLQEKTQFSERLQHGTPSGVDAAACVNGGTLLFQKGQEFPQPVTAAIPTMKLLFTGKPESTTGECLTFIRETTGDGPVWNDFEQCTRHLLAALEHNRRDEWLEGIRENHRLLCSIGVVPESTQEQVKKIEEAGGAAKIAGAGTVKGQHAGILTVYPDDLPDEVFAKSGLSSFTVQGGADGVALL